ncbi:glycosyltransferase family 4 protein [Undibacterium sp. TJN25]|uniref:glycosyltransferase family 4 protein n=1 Tax=Undibacterium sp. TJN25 TaxID=3413056 RepID=UPI003BF12577
METKAIHQFSPSCGKGDGVSNGMFFTRSLLRGLGFLSEIYCELIPDDLRHEVKHLSVLQLQGDDLLLAHHSLGYQNCAWLEQLGTRKVMVYHNITPPRFLPDNELPGLSVLGREQLVQWAPEYLGAIGDSDLNSAELRQAGYSNVESIPLLVDIDRMLAVTPEKQACSLPGDAYNILFVGRICEHKHQMQLIEMLLELRQLSSHPVRLILVGGVTSEPYLELVRKRIHDWQMDAQVVLTGKVSDGCLASLYRCADAYVSLSEHEGFGMPLIEAMLYDVPVIARAGSGVSATMGSSGMLLDEGDSPAQCAAAVHLVLSEPGLRRRMLEGQRRNVQRFSRERVLQQLSDFLRHIGVNMPVIHSLDEHAKTGPGWQMEGPFDSSYSLAIVNRELARSLRGLGFPMMLRSREGGGDFVPDHAFLQKNPDVALMLTPSEKAGFLPDVVLRNCYPPYLDDMHGRIRVVHSYGWEESGFPVEYVNAFNRKLDLITVVSRFVGKVLRDNGVRVPIAVVGNGIDHLLDAPAEPLSHQVTAGWRSFRFLHVSSCFPRKGVDALLAAYGRAFRDTDDVSLVIKTFPNPHNDVEQQLHKLRLQDPSFPHVQLISDDFSQAQLTGLYQACDALAAPSRGEGFGLPMAEAMLLNLPVITTAWSGQNDFCDDTTAWMCDYRFAKSDSHFGNTHSVWADPDVCHLASLLAEVHDSSEEQRLARTVPAKKRVLENFKWEHVATRTAAAVNALARQPLLRNEPRIGWISTWNARCGVASYSSFLTCGVPQDRLVVLAAHKPERTASDCENIFRCWDEGSDDNLDYAYDNIIEQGVGAVVIQYNFGFFTLDVLARLIRRLKQSGIAVHIFFHATADVIRPGYTISLSSIASDLAVANRLYVHGVDDLNRLKEIGLIDNVVFFPQGLMPTLQNSILHRDMQLRLQDKKLIAAYGFLLPHKGMQPLIQAFSKLAEGDSDLHLLLVTSLYPIPQSEHELNDCKRLVDEFRLGDRVTIISDYLEDEQSQALLQRAALIVYPYQLTQESSSAAVRMGLASGRPVAVTPLNIFHDVADAVHVLPGTDADSLMDGISDLLKNQQVLSEKARQAKSWRETRQWPALSARLLNIIDGIANAIDDGIGML